MSLSAARMAAWRWNPETNHLSWDEGLKQLLGLAPNEEITTYSEFLERVHQEQQGLLQDSGQRTVAGGDELNVQSRIVQPGGQPRWLASLGRVVRDGTGAV